MNFRPVTREQLHLIVDQLFDTPKVRDVGVEFQQGTTSRSDETGFENREANDTWTLLVKVNGGAQRYRDVPDFSGLLESPPGKGAV